MRGKSKPRRLVELTLLLWVAGVFTAVYWYTGHKFYIGALGGCGLVAYGLNVFSAAAPRAPGKHARSASVVTQLAVDQVGMLFLEMKALAARIDRNEAKASRNSAKLEHVFRTVAETNAEAGYSAPDLDETKPVLRVVGEVKQDDRQDEAG